MNKSLEGVRGAAALSVVLLHVGVPLFANCYLAVDLFFALSGYVIASAYSASLTSGATVLAFAVRRFGRIWPAHFVANALFYVLLAVCALVSPSVHFAMPSVREVAALLTMTQGLELFHDQVGNLVNWSVADEFWVYIAFAAVCLLTRGKARRVVAFAVLAVGGYALCLYGTIVEATCLKAGNCFDLTFHLGWARCLCGFFLGALLAEFRTTRAVRALAHPIAQAVVAAVVVLFAVTAGYSFGIALAAPIVFVALIASLTTDRGPVARFFQRSVLQSLGRVSYSLYLIHATIAPVYIAALHAGSSSAIGILFAVLGFIAASVLLAHVSYRFIEAPAREQFYRLSSIQTIYEPTSSSVPSHTN